jgi:hypothetical protein
VAELAVLHPGDDLPELERHPDPRPSPRGRPRRAKLIEARIGRSPFAPSAICRSSSYHSRFALNSRICGHTFVSVKLCQKFAGSRIQMGVRQRRSADDCRRPENKSQGVLAVKQQSVSL